MRESWFSLQLIPRSSAASSSSHQGRRVLRHRNAGTSSGDGRSRLSDATSNARAHVPTVRGLQSTESLLNRESLPAPHSPRLLRRLDQSSSRPFPTQASLEHKVVQQYADMPEIALPMHPHARFAQRSGGFVQGARRAGRQGKSVKLESRHPATRKATRFRETRPSQRHDLLGP